MSTCLVTGAAGFIGSHLCDRLLADGHRVVGVDALSGDYDVRHKRLNIASAGRRAKFSFVVGDVRAMDLGSLLRGIDLVFHLASSNGGDPLASAKARTTRRLLEAARAHPLSAFVHASSWSIYGDVAPMTEDGARFPSSAAALDEFAADECALRAGAAGDVPAAVARYFTVYGPRQTPGMAIAQFIEAAVGGRPARVASEPSCARDLIYVDDAVGATIAVALRGTPGRAYNVGSGHATTLSDMLGLVAEATSRRVTTEPLAAGAGTVARTCASIDRLRAELRVVTPPVSLDAGIAAQARAYVERRNALNRWSRGPTVPREPVRSAR